MSARNVPYLTGAGVRVGILEAIALALPAGGSEPLILSASSAVVLFSVVVQGLSLPAVARLTLPRSRP